MSFIFNNLLRGMRLPYRYTGNIISNLAVQSFFLSKTIIAQRHDSWRCRMINHGHLNVNTFDEVVGRPSPIKTNVSSISKDGRHTSLSSNAFFRYKNTKNGGYGNIMKLSLLWSLSLFSSREEGKEEKESELIIMIKRGILALKNGELNKAEQLLHVALKTAQEGQNEKAITYIFDLLANLAYQREEYTKAENLFKEVLKRMLQDGMPEDDNAIVEISLKLASVYASKNDYEKAVEGFRFCIGTQEVKIKKIGEKNLDEDTLLLWAMSMDWYARFLLSIQQFEMAKAHFIKAYEMIERVKGPEHTQTAVLLNDIGSVCSLQKNYTEAIQYLEKAIDAARISKSEDIASFYVNLGAVYLQQEVLSSAEMYCKEGLSLAKKMKNEEAVDEAKSCLAEITAFKSKK